MAEKSAAKGGDRGRRDSDGNLLEIVEQIKQQPVVQKTIEAVAQLGSDSFIDQLPSGEKRMFFVYLVETVLFFVLDVMLSIQESHYTKTLKCQYAPHLYLSTESPPVIMWFCYAFVRFLFFSWGNAWKRIIDSMTGLYGLYYAAGVTLTGYAIVGADELCPLACGGCRERWEKIGGCFCAKVAASSGNPITLDGSDVWTGTNSKMGLLRGTQIEEQRGLSGLRTTGTFAAVLAPILLIGALTKLMYVVAPLVRKSKTA